MFYVLCIDGRGHWGRGHWGCGRSPENFFVRGPVISDGGPDQPHRWGTGFSCYIQILTPLLNDTGKLDLILLCVPHKLINLWLKTKFPTFVKSLPFVVLEG
ncbi:hypothetical protein XENTR_v10023737 [Xenopus tropicalis]|nr:hypothetical protein XENTR_v10023737 [Xenopus tropicalis]